MTTIAFSGTQLASDSLSIDYGNLCQAPVKKLFHRGRYVFGMAGCHAFIEPCIQWVLDGADASAFPFKEPEGDRDYTVNMIVYDTETGICKCYAPLPKVPYGYEIQPPYAIGSGMDFALAAMALGKTAEEAIEVASRFDPNSGGPVQVIDLESLKAEAA